MNQLTGVADVVILGGGLAGLAAGSHSARRASIA
jgi:thioredoxin reductase